MARRRDRGRERRIVSETVQMDKAYTPVAPADKAATTSEAAAPPSAEKKPPPPAQPEAQSVTAASVPADEGALPLGKEQVAWASLTISEDHQTGTLTALALNGADVTAKQLAHDLAAAFDIQGRFDGKVLRRLIAEAAAEPVRGDHVVVRGTPAEAGTDGRIEWLCAPKDNEAATQALQADLAARLAAGSPTEALTEAPTVILVAPGQVLARRIAPTAGTPGKDLTGRVLTEPGQEAALAAGEHTRFEGEELQAQILGCVHREGDTLSVVPPVWVAADGMSASFLHFPELRRLPACQPGWLVDCLAAAGIAAGIDEEAVAALCADWPPATEARALILARGEPPEDGEDAHVAYTIDPSKRAGAVREDGSIDYRERNAAIGVAEGDVIGRVVAATQGTAGVDVHGKELPARDGEEHSFAAGANVTASTEDGSVVFTSQIDGVLQVAGEAIEVQPVYTISGDVDYETGNIDLPMNIEIGGSVKSEFRVRSQGSIVIAGVLEPGCQVVAEGDVVVAKGIFGETTRVVARGNVETKLIQNSTVTLEGDLTVGIYIYSGLVHAGGSVTVAEGSGARGGSIVGGEVIAGSGVKAKHIGSKETDRTLVGIDATPAEQAERGRVERDAQIAGTEERQCLDGLGLSGEPDDEALEARRRKCRTPEQLEKIEALIARLQAARLARTQADQQLAELQERLAERLRAAVVAGRVIYPDVNIDFGGELSRVGEEIASAEFYLSDEGLRWRPV